MPHQQSRHGEPGGTRTLSAYGFGSASGPYGGLIADLVRVPYADHLLVSLPPGLDPLHGCWRGVCTAVGYYVRPNTGIPLMHMYATDVTVHLGVSHPRAVLPELLDWVAERDFPAGRVTTVHGDFNDAPELYGARRTKVVLSRSPLEEPARTGQSPLIP